MITIFVLFDIFDNLIYKYAPSFDLWAFEKSMWIVEF
jgi:hypothetical protein